MKALERGEEMTAIDGTAVGELQNRFVKRRPRAKRAYSSAIDVAERAHELVTMASHDLRSPLAAMKIKAHHIVRRWQRGQEPTSAEWASAMLDISRATDEALAMIDEILALERLRNPQGPAVARAGVEIGTVIENAIAREQEALRRAHCQVTVFRQPGLDSARGPWDRAYLHRVFGNLLRNAAIHAPGTPVHITLSRRGDRLGIVFADHGRRHRRRSLSENDVTNRRFDARGVAPIHGIGLWIVRRAVERLGGRLRINSGTGRGLGFDVELPGLERRSRTS